MGAGSIVRERIGVNSSANITLTLSTPTYNRCRVYNTKTLADPARHIHAHTNIQTTLIQSLIPSSFSGVKPSADNLLQPPAVSCATAAK